MWNANLSVDELDALRDRWLERAYGSAWREMKAYYDLMLPENFAANAPAHWAKAVRLIAAADAKLDPAREPEAQRRLDDLKQFWYFYYLVDTGAMDAKSPEFVEFLWKGQMSYATAMHAVLKRAYNERSIVAVVPESLQQGPAHYTSAETAVWWQKILDHWPTVEVSLFADAVLADGRRGRDVDLNDLVPVADWQSLAVGKPFLFNSAQAPPTTFVTAARAGRPLGFRFAWPADPNSLRFYGPKDVPYGVEWWDAAARTWTPVVDVTTTTVASQLVEQTADGRARHVAEVELSAPYDGTYRVEVGRGGFQAQLASLGYDVGTATFAARSPLTFPDRPRGLTQDPVYLYVPQGTKSLDLEVWDSAGKKQVQLFKAPRREGAREVAARRHRHPRHASDCAGARRDGPAGSDRRQWLRISDAVFGAGPVGEMPRPSCWCRGPWPRPTGSRLRRNEGRRPELRRSGRRLRTAGGEVTIRAGSSSPRRWPTASAVPASSNSAASICPATSRRST